MASREVVKESIQDSQFKIKMDVIHESLFRKGPVRASVGASAPCPVSDGPPSQGLTPDARPPATDSDTERHYVLSIFNLESFLRFLHILGAFGRLALPGSRDDLVTSP
jgi:hypothetical protein